MSYRVIQEVPHKKRLEVLFMSHDELNQQQLALKVGLSLETVEAILYYKNSIMLDWKRSRDPFYRVPPSMHKMIACNEMLMEWKRRKLLKWPKVSDYMLQSKAKVLRNILKIKGSSGNHTWLQNFNDTYEKRHFTRHIRSSTKLLDIFADLLLEFPIQIQIIFARLFTDYKLNDNINTKKIRKVRKYRTSATGQLNVKSKSKCHEKVPLQINCNDVINDSDNDVEEIIQPIEVVDITGDVDNDCDNESSVIDQLICTEEITDETENTIDDINNYKHKMYDKNEMQQLESMNTEKQTDIVPNEEAVIVSITYEHVQNKESLDTELTEIFLEVEQNEPDCIDIDTPINCTEVNKKSIIRVKEWNELCAKTKEETFSDCNKADNDDDELVELLVYVTDNDESENEVDEQ